MVDIPLARSDYFRNVAKEARIYLRNRYFEQNPVLNQEPTALLARPAKKRWLDIGVGPVRGVYSQAGSFEEALFTVSGVEWYRVDVTAVDTLIRADIAGAASQVIHAGTGNIGDTPAFMYMADGTRLYVYTDVGYSSGVLTGTPADTDVVRVGSVYYQFTSGSVDAGTPAGTLAKPWLLAVGVSAFDSLTILKDALNAAGIPGADYSTALTQNTEARGYYVDVTASTLQVLARAIGAAGDTVVTTETGAALAWSGATLTNGGSPASYIVPTPDGWGTISIGVINSYIVVVPAQGQGVNGRFYWIAPGEIEIDPLDFATAERAPDPISDVVVFGDQFWLPGTTTTEVWYFTGNADAPVARLQGIAFDRGAWGGTAIQVKDSMIIVDSNGGVFRISSGGGGLEPIGRPDIAERIRNAIRNASI